MAQAAHYLLHIIHLQSCLSPCYADRIDFLQPARCRGLVCRCTDSIMAAKHCNRGCNENCDSALNLGVEVTSAMYSSLFIYLFLLLHPCLLISISLPQSWYALYFDKPCYTFFFLFFFAKSEKWIQRCGPNLLFPNYFPHFASLETV